MSHLWFTHAGSPKRCWHPERPELQRRLSPSWSTKQRKQAPQVISGRASLTQGHPQCYDQGYRETASCEEEWAAALARSKRPGLYLTKAACPCSASVLSGWGSRPAAHSGSLWSCVGGLQHRMNLTCFCGSILSRMMFSFSAGAFSWNGHFLEEMLYGICMKWGCWLGQISQPHGMGLN